MWSTLTSLCGLRHHLTSSVSPVINMATRGLHHLTINKCCFRTRAKQLMLSVFLGGQSHVCNFGQNLFPLFQVFANCIMTAGAAFTEIDSNYGLDLTPLQTNKFICCTKLS